MKRSTSSDSFFPARKCACFAPKPDPCPEEELDMDVSEHLMNRFPAYRYDSELTFQSPLPKFTNLPPPQLKRQVAWSFHWGKNEGDQLEFSPILAPATPETVPESPQHPVYSPTVTTFIPDPSTTFVPETPPRDNESDILWKLNREQSAAVALYELHTGKLAPGIKFYDEESSNSETLGEDDTDSDEEGEAIFKSYGKKWNPVLERWRASVRQEQRELEKRENESL